MAKPNIEAVNVLASTAVVASSTLKQPPPVLIGQAYMAVEGTNPAYLLVENDQGANAKVWGVWASSGILQIACMTDAGGLGSVSARFERSGSTANKFLVLTEIELDGALNHDGTTVGFFGATPVTQRAAYVQTYSTANRTVAAPTAAALVTLTDSTGLSGTHDDTLAATTVPADITGGDPPTEAEFNALLAVNRVMAQNISDLGQKVIELVAQVAALIADDLDNRQSINSLIDDSQFLGFAT